MLVLLSPRGDFVLDGAGGASRTLGLDIGLTGASTRASTGGGALTVMLFWPSWESAYFSERAWSTHLAGRGAELLHKLINGHDGSRGWGISRGCKVLAGAFDLDVTSGIVILALDSPIGADVGLASLMGCDLTGGERHPGDDA